MQVRLIEEGFDERHPWALCDENGLVVARFKDETQARDWTTRNHFEIDQTEYPHYGD